MIDVAKIIFPGEVKQHISIYGSLGGIDYEGGGGGICRSKGLINVLIKLNITDK